MGCTPQSQTLLYNAHRGAWLGGEMHNPESDSAVRSTPQSLTQWCNAYRWVRLGSGMHTAEFFENFYHLTPLCDTHRGAWLRGGMHTVELDSEWCTPRSDAHCAPQSFLKIRISWQNQNQIRKYFNLFIRALDGFESWKKWRSKISWHTPFKKTAKINGWKMPILKIKYLVNGWRDNADFLICYKL